MYVTGPDGKRYKSINEMCDEYGIKYITYKRRRERGMSVEKALTDPLQGSFIGPDGRLHKSLSSFCKEYRLNYNTVTYLIKHGHTLSTIVRTR